MVHPVGGSSLGNRIGTFHGLNIGFHNWVFVFLPWGLVTIFILINGTLLARNKYQKYGPSYALTEARKWYLIAMILLVLIFAYFLYRLSISLRRIDVFEDGLIYSNFPLPSRYYRWSDISGITAFAKTFTFMEKDLQTIPGGTIFSNISNPIPLTNRIQNIPNLVELIKSKIYPIIWPNLLEVFQFGKIIPFGRIFLCNKYLAIDKRQIPWASIFRLSVQAGYLVIESTDQTNYKIPISTIPNLELLLRLVELGLNP